MVLPVAVGVFLAFAGRLANHRVMALLRERGRVRQEDADHFGVFLVTVGVAIALWFALGALFQWQVPLPWRLAAIVTGYLIADGLVGASHRGR